MTVIVYRDGVMAADSLLSASGSVAAFADKVRDINGWLIGIAGDWGVACELFDWFESECKEGLKRPPATIAVGEDKYPVNMLLVNKKDGVVLAIDGLGYPQKIKGPFFSIGSGADIAIGACEVGASAVDAVKAAIKHSCSCGGKTRAVKRG